MEGGIAILLIVVALVVAAVVGLVIYLTGMTLGGRLGAGSDHTPPEPLRERHLSPRETERQLKPEVRQARERQRRAHDA